MLTKGGFIMCALNLLGSFFSNGAKTLHDAALGQYTHESTGISEIRAELFDQEISDGERVRGDWRMLGRLSSAPLDGADLSAMGMTGRKRDARR